MLDETILAIENAVRYGAVDAARRAGVTDMNKLAQIAMDSTVDFGKVGLRTQTWNRLIPFLNARIQGVSNIFTAMKNNPERFAEVAMWTAIYPELRLYQHNRDFETYKNIPNFITDNFYVYMIGEHETVNEEGLTVMVPQFISVPKGEAQKLIANPFQYLLRASDNLNTRETGEMLVDTLLSLSPLSFQSLRSDDLISGVVGSFGPVGRMLVGNMTNYDTFTGKPIIPEYLADVDPKYQKTRTTPKATEVFANTFGWSPAKVQFNIEALFAGMGRDLTSILSVPLELDKPQRGLSETGFGQVTQTPMLRSFVREASDYYSVENVRLRDYIDDVNKRSGNVRAEKNNIKQEIKKDLAKYAVEDRMKRLQDMVVQEVISRDLAKEIYDDIVSQITPTMKLLKGAGVENFGRAEIIYSYLSDPTVSEKEKASFKEAVVRDKIMTEVVARQIRYLELNDGIIPQQYTVEGVR
jgi:hypothetical protein